MLSYPCFCLPRPVVAGRLNRKNRLFLWARKRRIRLDVVWAALQQVGAPPTLSQKPAVRHSRQRWDGVWVSYRCPYDYRDITEEQLEEARRWIQGRDICYYCGFDTTDLRHGWYCAWCGSC